MEQSANVTNGELTKPTVWWLALSSWNFNEYDPVKDIDSFSATTTPDYSVILECDCIEDLLSKPWTQEDEKRQERRRKLFEQIEQEGWLK